MGKPNEKVFLHFWPKCFIVFMAVIELLCALLLLITELGNVGANFWTTNVFAGGWCGLIIFIHTILVFLSGCCSPGSKSAYRGTIVGIVGLIAAAALISFDATFIILPTMCILTPACVQNAASNTTFSYGFRQSFFTIFNNGPFKSYQESHVKFLCQTIQLGIGALCFLLCLVYIIIYYITESKANKQVGPSPMPPRPHYVPPRHPPPASFSAQPPAAQGYYPPPPPPLPPAVQPGHFQPLPSQPYYQPPAPVWRPPPVQGPPGAQPYYYQ